MSGRIKCEGGRIELNDEDFEKDECKQTCYATWTDKKNGQIFKVLARKVSITENDHLKEISTLKRLRHANILSYIEGFVLGDYLIVVTELAPKGSLFEYLKVQLACLPPELLFRWSLDIARAIKFIQDNHIIHRDIKSANCVIAGDTDSIKLHNFGLDNDMFQADKSSGDKDRGSYPWMAPEVIREKKHSDTSDTYSWAVILWEMLTGKEPFSGMTGGHLIWKITQQHAKLDIPVNISTELRRIIAKSWDHDRRQRPSITQIIDVMSMNRQIFGPGWIQDKKIYVDGSKWHYTRGLTCFGIKQQVALCCWERPSGGRGAVEVHTMLRGQYEHEYTCKVNMRNWRPWDVVVRGDDIYVVCAYNKFVYRFPCTEAFKESTKFALIDGDNVDPYCIGYDAKSDKMVVCLEHRNKCKVVEYAMPDFRHISTKVVGTKPTNHSVDINMYEGKPYIVVCDNDGVHVKSKSMKLMCSLQVPADSSVDAVAFGKGPLATQIFLACEAFGQVSIYRYICDSKYKYTLAGTVVEGIKEAPKVGLVVTHDGRIAVSERLGHTVKIFKIGDSKANFVSF